MVCKQMRCDFNATTESVGERLGQDAAYVIDSTRAREEFGWTPKIDLSAGLRDVIAWVHDRGAEIRSEAIEYIHKP